MSAITDNSGSVVTYTSGAHLTPIIGSTSTLTVGANMVPTFGSAFTVTNGANLTLSVAYGLFGSRYINRSLLSSYGFGELSGAFVLLDGIASNTIYLPSVGYDDVFTNHAGTTIMTQCKYYGQASDYSDFWSYFGKLWIICDFEDVLPSAWSRLCQGATQLRILATEVRLQLQAAALARLLVAIWIVVRVVAARISSLVVTPGAAAFIIRTIMAHRNSREPAYHPILCLPLYQSLAGVVLAH
jgi:hypothetical protein